MEAQGEDREQALARHRKELKDLQARITNKKKNASKKTRKGINDECAAMERQLRETQAAELAALDGEAPLPDDDDDDNDDDDNGDNDLRQEQADIGDKKEEKSEERETKGEGEPAAETRTRNKNRNRQKERMARRAAEQEAAAAKAEQEAANMTDHRARESEAMTRAFRNHGLVEKDIAPDGHCLFSAVADQLRQHGVPLADPSPFPSSSKSKTKDTQIHSNADAKNGQEDAEEPGYRVVRRAAAEYMAAHAEDFAPFMEEDVGSYVARVRDTAEWGGQLELMALARRYGVEIRVIRDGGEERIGEHHEGKTLWLAYYRHGYGLGEHYNSLRMSTSTAQKPGAVG